MPTFFDGPAASSARAGQVCGGVVVVPEAHATNDVKRLALQRAVYVNSLIRPRLPQARAEALRYLQNRIKAVPARPCQQMRDCNTRADPLIRSCLTQALAQALSCALLPEHPQSCVCMAM